jgi:hypothetical protein
MPTAESRPPRPRLTARIAAYALADVFGLTCLGLGASWFAAGKGAIIEGFPASLAEAVACTGGGAAVMFWAVARILREIALQAPEMQARYERYIATHHPEKSANTEDQTQTKQDSGA